MKYLSKLSAIIPALFFLSFSPLLAQIGETRKNISIGINGGIILNKVSFDPTIRQNYFNGATIGATMRLTSEKYFKTLCSLQIELNYSQLGWNENIHSSADISLSDTYKRKINYIQLPLLARLGWGKEKKGLMAYFLAGPQVGFCINEKSIFGSTWTLNEEGVPDRLNNIVEQYDMPIKHKFDYGITAGLGLEANTKLGHFMIDGRYYYGLSDIYSNGKKDVFSRSNHGSIVVKITYLLDIKHHKS